MMTGTPMNSKMLMLMLVGPSFVGGGQPLVEPVVRNGPAPSEGGGVTEGARGVTGSRRLLSRQAAVEPQA